jgi:hypothetical protein
MCKCKDCKSITLLKGTDGVGIVSITDNGDGTFTILLSNGTTFTTQDLTGPQGPQGDPGQDGQDGQSIDHVSFTSTTNPGGTPGAAGQTDTYTVWGDVAETINLGTFEVYNGTNGVDGGGCCPTISVRDNENAQTAPVGALNALIINQYDANPYSQFDLPSTAALGSYVEIVDEKSTFPTKTRVRAAAGQTIYFSGLGNSTVGGYIDSDNSTNGSIKLVCTQANTKWAVVNYAYFDNAGLMLVPTFG